MAYVSQKDKAQLAPQIKKVLNKYGMKGSISIRHHSTLVVTIQSGSIKFDHSHGDGYTQVNVYHIESHYKGKAQKFLTELLAAMKGPGWFDKSDSMTDYFHVKHYCDINIGRWNKPYFLQNTAKKAPKKPVQASIKLPSNFTITDKDTAEDLARMNTIELDKVVDRLVDSYPTLAETLMSRIGYAMLDKEGV
jgi:hypothetical protein